ncbi:hypothetical protein UFOVP961_48 [uncultured Caudovirales phage]|uniref:Uncharacterized protein n=1 Tax=uncultured Caudovirales phage TaxID=2100421 RepID=A0A6J5RLV8_9CAUD|nr:hypothetical protein UFOVP961_48 [uncultured Caudovirales phage]CAB4185664.1 hypothetical protein UFOVP1123_118 [uncultured Caudovirales phage]CAB4193155.1 hypothetical protein UFOVP1239_32 [uncultured Caudovirales phage]CAB4216202.1 hypothetical protein UFOVP1484_122 [uncultured Caudovirales phage]CAB5230828.1 hypothetical protein UFOVP1577_128 [uncultured Caudovirales phage]
MEQKKNSRKFRVWDDRIITANLHLCLQYQVAIENAAGQVLVPEDLPHSTIPTASLYDIVCAFAAMYEKLLVEGLVQSNTNIATLNKNFH